jgi:putative transposase
MPRRARIVAVGYPHHITQRGNNRRQVFYSDQDRALYLELLQEYASQLQVGQQFVQFDPGLTHDALQRSG